MAKKKTVEEVRKAYYELSEIERKLTGLKPCYTCHLCDADLSPTMDDEGDLVWPSEDLILFDLNAHPQEWYDTDGYLGREVPICDNCISNNHVILERAFEIPDEDVDDDGYNKYWRLCCELQGIPEKINWPDTFQEYYSPGDFILTAQAPLVLKREAERRKKSNEWPFDNGTN